MKKVGIFILMATLQVQADLRVFVEDHVKIESCKFDKPFILATLRTGLERVSKVNERLSGEIQTRTSGKNLTIFCDVLDRAKPIFYREEDHSIHLRVTNDGSGMTNANFFHEFLHFAGLNHIEVPEDAPDIELFGKDPVYACHLTAFPEMAEISGKDVSVIEAAQKKCSTVNFEE